MLHGLKTRFMDFPWNSQRKHCDEIKFHVEINLFSEMEVSRAEQRKEMLPIAKKEKKLKEKKRNIE